MNKRRAFTLVELLAVLAVIALLGSLLLPALSRSKSTGQRVKCVANLHQLGLAAQMYWDDNAGHSFPYRGGAVNGGDVYWFGWLERGGEGKRAFDATLGALHPYLGGRGVEICPSLNYSLLKFKLKALGAAYGYGYNIHLSVPASEPPVNIFKLARPTGLVLLTDAAQVNTFQAPASPQNPMLEEFYYVSTNEASAHFRHGQTAHAAFCDGHVGREKMLPGSLDERLPNQCVGRLRPEVLRLW